MTVQHLWQVQQFRICGFALGLYQLVISTSQVGFCTVYTHTERERERERELAKYINKHITHILLQWRPDCQWRQLPVNLGRPENEKTCATTQKNVKSHLLDFEKKRKTCVVLESTQSVGHESVSSLLMAHQHIVGFSVKNSDKNTCKTEVKF